MLSKRTMPESKSTCESGGYTCTESASGSGCWKRTGNDTCPSGYSTDYQSVSDCGSSGANGWTFTTSGQSGGETCGKCTAKTCPTDTSTSQTCSNGTYTKGTAVGSSYYAGNSRCYSCEYTCNNTSGYTSNSSCTSGGYTCTSVVENEVTCYRRTGSQSCPSEYPNSSACTPSGTGFTTSQSTTTVGDNTCYKCSYACASGWNSRHMPERIYM